MDYDNEYQLMLVFDCGDYTSTSEKIVSPKSLDLWPEKSGTKWKAEDL